MTKHAKIAHFLGLLLILYVGAMLLYFYGSGRVESFLTGEKSFRLQVLVAGVAMVLIGIFNLLTAGEDCGCDHDHDHDHGVDGDDDPHGCGHDHAHGCGHEHGEDSADEKAHDHNHAHEQSHEHHGGCCGGHDHDHDHHDHDHHAEGEASDHGHNHDHHAFFGGNSLWSSILAGLIICVPLTLAAVWSPDSFSAQAVINKGLYSTNYGAGGGGDMAIQKGDGVVSGNSAVAPGEEITVDLGEFTLADLEAQVDRNEAGDFLLEVPELYYTAGDREVQKVLEGQPVETIAQVMPEKLNNDAGNRIRLFRLFIECCAADARPLSIPAEFSGTVPDFREMGWVKVTGTMAYLLEGGVTVPILRAESMEEVPEPEEAMMY